MLFLEYPATFALVDIYDEGNYRTFEIRNHQEAMRLFPHIFTKYVLNGTILDKDDLVYRVHRDGDIRIVHSACHLYTKVKKLPLEKSKAYPVLTFSLTKVRIYTWDIANDIGRIRYALRQARSDRTQRQAS